MLVILSPRRRRRSGQDTSRRPRRSFCPGDCMRINLGMEQISRRIIFDSLPDTRRAKPLTDEVLGLRHHSGQAPEFSYGVKVARELPIIYMIKAYRHCASLYQPHRFATIYPHAPKDNTRPSETDSLEL